MEFTRDDRKYTVADGYDGFWKIFQNKTWEPSTFKIFDAFLDKNHNFVDIGSWIGPTVLYAAPYAQNVYAFEPDPVAYRALTLNVELNALKNVVPYPIAVSDRWKGMDIGIKNHLGDSMTSELWVGKGKTSKVAAVGLEAVIQDLQPNFVKIDIEGGERTIFDGNCTVLADVKPTIHLSLHTPWFKQDVDEIKVAVWEGLHLYPYFYNENLQPIEFDAAFDVNKFNSIVASFKKL